MNILFLISSNGKGAGGHYNSLHQVSSEVSKAHQIKVILLGKGDSPIIKSNPNYEGQIKIGHGIRDFKSLKKELAAICVDFMPDIIHCFDMTSLNSILIANVYPSVPVVVNKCGGPNPLKSNYQHAHATVVFSKENQDWYLKSKHYKNDSIFLIPNRVRALSILPKNKRKEKADNNKITFLRISRLGGAYELTLNQTYNLLDRISEKQEVELFVVGRIQDHERFENLKQIGLKKSYKVYFITDERANKGSDFLYLADFAIGTGRSFMEATSLGIPTLTPAKNSEIPILVEQKNIERYLATNFSERNIASETDINETPNKITNLTADKTYYKAFQEETRDFFEEFFGTSKINLKYNEVYSFAINQKTSRFSLIKKNFVYLLRYYFKGY